MTRIFSKGFELNTIEVKSSRKAKKFVHDKDCDKKSISESTKHFTFIAGCKCRLKYTAIDEEETVS